MVMLLMVNITAMSDAIPAENPAKGFPERPSRRTFARRAVDSTGFSVSFEVHVWFLAFWTFELSGGQVAHELNMNVGQLPLPTAVVTAGSVDVLVLVGSSSRRTVDQTRPAGICVCRKSLLLVYIVILTEGEMSIGMERYLQC